MVFADAGDPAVVLTEISSDVYAMDHAVGVTHETFDRLREAERSGHPEAVERETLERFACAILIRMRARSGGLLLILDARDERVAQLLILVFERFERTDH